MRYTVGCLLASTLVVSACTGPPSRDARPAAPTARAEPADHAEVPDDRTAAIPRVDDADTPLPPFTTATTVLDTGRPAIVLTFPDAVLFAFGSAELRPEAEAALAAAVDLLRRHPGAHAEVAGHTDSVGSDDYNRRLSQRRAAAVVDWLVDHGVPGARLRPVGYGATRPVAGNATEDDRRRNRRVELTVT